MVYEDNICNTLVLREVVCRVISPNELEQNRIDMPAFYGILEIKKTKM